MGPRDKNKYKEVVRLRLQAKSYREITLKVRVAKSTVSKWCKNLELPSRTKRFIQERNAVAQKRFAGFNEKRTRRIFAENQEIISNAQKQVKLLSKRDLMLVGVALYWAEGYKIEKQKYPLISFANSDYAMAVLFKRFLREIMGIRDEELSLSIRIYPGMNKEKIVEFWSKMLCIPIEKFRVGYQVSRASQRKKPFNALPFGTIRILVCGRKNSLRVKGWIDGLKHQSGLNEYNH